MALGSVKLQRALSEEQFVFFFFFQALVVMTDGISQDRVRRPALALKSQGVRVFALGIGRRYRRRELHQIATNGRYVFTANFRSLNQAARRISRKICRCKSIAQCPA